MNLALLLQRSARCHAERPAVFSGDRLIHRFSDLGSRVARIAGGLRGRFGLAPGDRVAMVMANCPAYVELLWAIWQAGLVAVPLNAKLHAREIAYILEHSGARTCFATEDLAETVTALQPELPELGRIAVVPSAEFGGLVDAEAAEPARRAPDDLAWLFYTSGTTGRPKGAMLSHRNLLTMALCYHADVDPIAPGECLLHAAPMSHGSGIYMVPHIAAGSAQLVPASGKFDPVEIFNLMKTHRGIAMFGAPTMVKRLVEHPGAAGARLDGLKTIVYGGGPMYVADLQKGLATLGNRFVQIYGQGESPMCITSLSRARHGETGHPRYLDRLASVGTAQTAVELRVADGDDRDLPVGEAGEVLVRGSSVMPGYWNNPAATAETLRGGWLHTGDVGALDADGFLTLKDRSKDMIISGGSNIYPREVEEVLLTHAGVAEASVIGRPHAEWGEEVVAFVVRAAGASPVAEAELDRLCQDRIARFKRPRAYRFVEVLPKNNYGKVLKTELRASLAMPAPLSPPAPNA